jgi:hypothetical protein
MIINQSLFGGPTLGLAWIMHDDQHDDPPLLPRFYAYKRGSKGGLIHASRAAGSILLLVVMHDDQLQAYIHTFARI